MSPLASRFFACEECGEYFAADDGGVCGRCGRMLCREHLLGPRGWWRRWLSSRPACVSCRATPRHP